MKRKLLSAAFALLGISAAWADTELLKSEDGWEKITTISQSDITNNFYVFVTNDADLMLGLSNSTNQGNKAAFFQASADPTTSLNKVWYLEANGENYAMRNVEYTYLQLQTEWGTGTSDNRWRTNDQPNSCGWTGLGLSYDDGAWALTSTQYNQPLGIYDNGEGTPTEGQELGANDAGKGQKFQIYAMAKKDFIEKYVEANGGATAEKGFDVSAFIINPDFADAKNGGIGWTRTGTWGNQQFDGGAMEYWNNTNVSVTQTLYYVPNGKYKLSVDMISGPERPKNAYIYAKGDIETNGDKVSAETTPADPQYPQMCAEVTGNTLTIDEIVVSSNEITIGFKDPSTGDGWVVVDNFKLEYLGNEIDMSWYKETYESALAEANKVNTESLMNKDVKSAIVEAKAKYSTISEETIENYTEAINALSSAATNANNSIAAYANSGIDINAFVETIKPYVETTNVYTEEAYNKWVVNVQENYNNGEYTDAEVVNLNANGAFNTGWHSSSLLLQNVLLSAWTIGGEQAKDYLTALYINTWSTEGADDDTGFNVPFLEYWTDDANSLGANTIVGTVTDLPAGTYEISAWVRARAKNNVSAADATGITFSVNGGNTIDVTEGANVGQFNIAEYKARGVVGEDGKLTVTFNVLADNNVSWLSFQNVKYSVIEVAGSEDYAALNAAIAEAESKLGFEEGEYAPYNNIEALKALAAAKAIDQSDVNAKEDVQAATTALEEAEWTANAEEVNAFGDPTFSKSENDGAQIGWVSSNTAAGLGGALHSRAFVLNAGETNYDQLGVFNQGDGVRSASYFRFDGINSGKDCKYTYGETEGYTMPLKQAVYNFTAQLGGWGQAQPLKIAIVNDANEEVASQTVNIYEDNKISALGNTVINVEFLVAVQEAGNYKLVLSNGNTSADNAIAISNLSLFKAVNPTVEVAITEAGYATFSSEYALSLDNLPEGLEAYYVQAANVSQAGDDETGYVTLTEIDAAVEAGEGILLKGEAGTYDIPVAVSGSPLDGNILIAGTGEKVAAGNYVFSCKKVEGEEVADPTTAGFYKLGEETEVPKGKAYIDASQLPAGIKVLRFAFGGDIATAIEAAEAADADAEGAIYNVAGQQVGKDYKGIVIKNGKKYLNK